jgi:excisionase family DNA binding protein
MNTKKDSGSAGDSPYLTVVEFAKHFRVHPRTVWRRIAEKIIKATRFGRRTLIHRREIKKWDKGEE